MSNSKSTRIKQRDPTRPDADDEDTGTAQSHHGTPGHEDVRERGPDTGGGKLRPDQS